MSYANEGNDENRPSKIPHRSSTDTPEVSELIDVLELSPGDVALDFGAGTGRFTLPIAERLDALDRMGLVVACDFSRMLLRRLSAAAEAKGLAGRVRSICLNDLRPFSLPAAKAQVDCVLAVNSLHYLDSPLPYLFEVARILKPNGALVIADWNSRESRNPVAPSLRTVKPKHLDPLLTEAGLSAVGTVKLNGYAWVIRATKVAHVKQENPLLGSAVSISKLGFDL